MEAMANGLSVICSDIRGNRDLIQNQRGGCLVPANEVKQWQAAIKQGIDKKNSWLKYGRYNQQRVNVFFSSSTVNKQLKKVYFSSY